jgi:hypothetical protein
MDSRQFTGSQFREIGDRRHYKLSLRANHKHHAAMALCDWNARVINLRVENFLVV